MRPDMAKVIVERPRHGSRSPSRKKGYRKYVQLTPIDEQRTKEPMLGSWKGRGRWLNEHLGPMRRFLRSNVGRPWNKVHQELCEYVSFDNAVQGHVLAHIYDYVHLHVDVIDSGTVYRMPRRSLHDRLTVNAMYICPRTGILKVVRAKRARGPGKRISFGGLTQYHFRDNAWWEVEVRNSEDASPDRWDVWLERPLAKITDAQLIVSYGGKLVATSKRLLTRRESRQLYRRIRRNQREV
jgi:hypothetical protein